MNSIRRHIFLVGMVIHLILVPLVATEWNRGQRFLLEQETNTFVTAKDGILANRIYSIYSAEFNQWIYTLSDGSGKIAEPLEVISTGSVVVAGLLGVRDSRKNYVLSSNGKWQFSNSPEKLKVIHLGRDPKIRTVERVDLTKSKFRVSGKKP